jgi:hypothetical protein
MYTRVHSAYSDDAKRLSTSASIKKSSSAPLVQLKCAGSKPRHAKCGRLRIGVDRKRFAVLLHLVSWSVCFLFAHDVHLPINFSRHFFRTYS